jgi:AcrR family transcriptional regulator
MPTQAERRSATIEAIGRAASHLFATKGFAATTIDDIAERAGVAKGAVYHHFASKEDIFAVVFEDFEAKLETDVVAAGLSAEDPFEGMERGVRHFLAACSEPRTRQIVLVDGPAVLGWKRWREIDAKYFAAVIRGGLARALEDKAAERHLDALSHLILGSLTEAALVCASAADARAAAREMTAGIRVLLQGLKQSAK